MAKVKNTAVKDSVLGGDIEPAVNKYFGRISRRFMVAKYLSVVLLVIFLAFMMIRFSDDITYANMMYLLRDFNTGGDVMASGFASVEYDEQENMSFSMYRGELCVIGNRTLKMYNVRGEETRSYTPGYSDPALVSSDKYLLAYNIGTPAYSVYTSIARVHNTEAIGDITAASVNNNGDYLLVCRSKDTKYVVCTYDSSFREIADYYKSKYVTSAAIGDDCRVVTASFDSSDTSYECVIELYYDGSQKPDSTYTAQGVFPVKCGIFENGGYYVICTDRILFFDESGKLVEAAETADEYTAYSASGDRLAVSSKIGSVGGTSNVVLFNTAGEVQYNKSVDGNVSSVSVFGDRVSVLAGEKVYSITSDTVMSAAAEPGGNTVISGVDSSVVCYKFGTEGIQFDSPDNEKNKMSE